MPIPRCMSTQHPDNARSPFFADEAVIQGEAEIREAYYAYSQLGCTEQMWDCEGKEVDAFVVKKLLTQYDGFFESRRLGDAVRLTLRVPNPRVEKVEAKVLLESLESIPRSCDAARLFYGDDEQAPIYEVILPMTSSSEELDRLYRYYREFVSGKSRQRCYDLTIREWVGDFRPATIDVIPLIEDRDHLLEADRIVETYLQDKESVGQRVFLARSDPALNYGQIGAVLLLKVSLQRLSRLERRLGIPLYPILGVGSAPFRGNLKPTGVQSVLREYPSVQTFTVQSAFKYDYPETEVRAGIAELNESTRSEPCEVDEAVVVDLADRVAARYASCVEALAPMVNAVAPVVPPRRARKLHIGLFGYSRELNGNGDLRLPRAIRFCAALYTLGLPPEILGIGALSQDDLRILRRHYMSLDQDMGDSLRYLCEANLQAMPPIVRQEVDAARAVFDYERDDEHAAIAESFLEALQRNEPANGLTERLVRAAWLRQFLG